MKSFWKDRRGIAGRLAAGRLLVTLDFDGTLAAIAETPGDARLTREFRLALRRLSDSPGVSVFILSGRALADVRRLVGIKDIYYGGNHGMELSGPGLRRRDAAALAARPLIAAISGEVRDRFPAGTGVLVENKDFSASVHYRALKPAWRRGFFAHMRALTAGTDRRLRWSRGNKVFELRPAAAPHKGDAVLRLRKLRRAEVTLAVGDDLTDEDMFRVLARSDLSVRVGRRTSSAAEYYLPGQKDVLRLLEFISVCRRGPREDR